MLSHIDGPGDGGAAKRRSRDAAVRTAVVDLADALDREDCVAVRANMRDVHAHFVPDAGKSESDVGL